MQHSISFFLALAICAYSSFSIAQNNPGHIMLASGSIQIENSIDIDYSTKEIVQGHVYRLIQFNELPSKSRHEEIRLKGISLNEYLPYKAYLARLPITLRSSDLEGLGLYGVVKVPAQMKMLKRLVERPFPAWSNDNGKVKVAIKLYDGFDLEIGVKALESYANIDQKVIHSRLIYMSVDEEDLEEISLLQTVRYVDLAPEPGRPEHDHGRSLHRANMLDQDYGAGRNYDGTGVTVAVNDDGFVGPHIDFTGRTEQTDVAGDFVGDHGDMVAGILGGAGNLDPTMRGMAPGSFLFIRQYNSSLPDAVNLHLSDQVMVFNSSYGDGCNSGYSSLTEQVDDEIHTYQSLIQVFSAGNSGGSDCGYGAGGSFGNITGGHKIGKNVIATANLDENDNLENSSSRGPSEDGRLKPDISAHGAGQMSTDPDNTYAAGGGTSAAAPGIAGVTAQMIHAYREMNSGDNPKSGLIKACLLNSADDLGNVGPDYSYGWGRVNGHKAVSILENGNYLYDSVDNAATNNHAFIVPTGVAELRVMAYWMDEAGSPSSSIILVNDLDLTVTDPSLSTLQPLVLDPTPNVTNLSATAIPGRDSLNNMEQVRIVSPAAGAYVINVDGFAVPAGNQPYFIVWEFIYDDITVTYPVGGEGFVPGEQEIIRWDAYGNTGTFDVQYSLDDGASWTFVASSIAGTERQRVWTVPSGPTERALIQVTRGGVSDTSDVNFVIAETPANIQIDWVCVDSLQLSWDPVPGAMEYEVSMLGSMYMDSVGRTTADSIILYGHNYNAEDWISVKAVLPNGGEGRRANAIQKAAGISNCPMIYGVEMTEILSPVKGSFFNCHDGSTIPIIVNVTNVGLNPVYDIPVSYQLNGGTIVSETIFDTLQPGEDTIYTFSSTIDISSNGTYQSLAWSEYALDQFLGDDTLNLATNTVTAATYTTPFVESFDGFTLCGTSSDCGSTICNLSAGWKNESSSFYDDNDWRTDDDGTPSTGTGPNVDNTLGTSSGKYLYTEASGGCTEAEARLISPCFDLAGNPSPMLEFYYHMDGNNMGDLHVDIFNGTTWDEDVVLISGEQSNSWEQSLTSISQYAGMLINVRFRGITGDDYLSDMAIDDFGIQAPIGVDEMGNSGVQVWPNPTIDLVNINYQGLKENSIISLTNLLGQSIETKAVVGQDGMLTFSTSSLESGTYLVVVYSDNVKVSTEKIVVLH